MQLLDQLGSAVDRIREVVPECLGVSLSRADQDPFTIAVSDEAFAVLDAVQYLDGGPGVHAARRRRWGETWAPDRADDRWDLFARACAKSGVGCTLTLPVGEGEVVTGAVQLYAATEHAFEQGRDDLGRAVDAVAPDVVRGSEATLMARQMAEPAPSSLRGQGAVNRALGELAVHLGIDPPAAYERLDDAALRAGITRDRLALALMDLHH